MNVKVWKKDQSLEIFLKSKSGFKVVHILTGTILTYMHSNMFSCVGWKEMKPQLACQGTAAEMSDNPIVPCELLQSIIALNKR